MNILKQCLSQKKVQNCTQFLKEPKFRISSLLLSEKFSSFAVAKSPI